MSSIISIFVLTTAITVGVCYISMHFAKKDEATLVNNIHMNYPNNVRHLG